jgi:hypothetical protein
MISEKFWKSTRIFLWFESLKDICSSVSCLDIKQLYDNAKKNSVYVFF